MARELKRSHRGLAVDTVLRGYAATAKLYYWAVPVLGSSQRATCKKLPAKRGRAELLLLG